MEFLALDFPGRQFDAVLALNCLLHVPLADFAAVLERIRPLLRPAGLFFLGQYGGEESEGINEGDSYTPKRFFSSHSDDCIKSQVSAAGFEIIDFHTVPVGSARNIHFQSLTLRAPSD